MIVCSCTVITDAHIETALLEILGQPDAPIPTPGVVFRHLSKKMNCCGCAPLLVSTIYQIVQKLEREERICPCACESAKTKLEKLFVAHRRTDWDAEPVRASEGAAELTSV
ncbi:MAG: hypothetical protein HC868_06115 [Sphingomonadales bacterium]|nr:hypothetical protein [Sphingomonadales bacterium]